MGCFGFLLLLPGRQKGVQQISVVWQTSRPRLRLTHTFCPVFKSNQFSFVPNRKGNIFRQDVLWSPVLFFWWLFLYRIFRNRGEGICFEFMLWIFDEFLQSSYMGVFTGFCSNFLWMVVVGLVWVPRPLRPNGSRTKKPKREWDGEVMDVRNNFSYARSGTSFQWWTRRRWLCENLKYANSV